MARQKIYRSIFFLILLLGLTSCQWVSGIIGGDEVVAKVEKEKLYKSELEALLPANVSKEEKDRLAKQYIYSWASDRVFLKIANEKLSKEEKDVTKELEDYRKSLLKYRYEQSYVNERLDTAVTSSEMEAYFSAHSEKFKLSTAVAKLVFLCISSDSPLTERIRVRMSSDESYVLEEADSLAYAAALRYTDFENQWVDLTKIARECSLDYTTFLSYKEGKWIEYYGNDGALYVVYLRSYVPAGEVAPFEYAMPFIKDIIISNRKQALVNTLEQDLLKQAIENKDFVIEF